MDYEFNDSEIRKLTRIAKAHFINLGYPEYIADDFAQYYLLKRVCEGRLASIDLILIDFLREEFGSLRSHKGRKKSYALLKAREKEEKADSAEIPEDDKLEIPGGFDVLESYVINRLAHDQTHTDVAEELGYSIGQMHHMIKKIRYKAYHRWDWTGLDTVKKLAGAVVEKEREAGIIRRRRRNHRQPSK
jgi:hypothetical protein